MTQKETKEQKTFYFIQAELNECFINIALWLIQSQKNKTWTKWPFENEFIFLSLELMLCQFQAPTSPSCSPLGFAPTFGLVTGICTILIARGFSLFIK